MSATAIAVRLLLADEDLNSAVAGRVYPVVAPQTKTLPYLVVSLVYESQDVVLDGQRDGYSSRVSVHCVADKPEAADRLGELVKRALSCVIHQTVNDGASQPMAVATVLKNGTDLLDFNDDRTVFRRLLDYDFRWTPAP